MAAGSSSRLGSLKQLVKLNDKLLIEIAIENALAVAPHTDIYVVLGANFLLIAPKIYKYEVNILENLKWEIGMSTSVILGLTNSLDAVGVMFMVADQPLIPKSHFTEMISKFNSQKIIATKFEENLGVPMLVPKLFFEEILSKVKGDRGAAFLLRKHPMNVEFVVCPQAKFDVDTQEDLDLMRGGKEGL